MPLDNPLGMYGFFCFKQVPKDIRHLRRDEIISSSTLILKQKGRVTNFVPAII